MVRENSGYKRKCMIFLPEGPLLGPLFLRPLHLKTKMLAQTPGPKKLSDPDRTHHVPFCQYIRPFYNRYKIKYPEYLTNFISKITYFLVTLPRQPGAPRKAGREAIL